MKAHLFHKLELSKINSIDEMESIFISPLVLVGWLIVFCGNCLMLPIYMMPFGFAGRIIFFSFIVPLGAVVFGILFYGCRRSLITKGVLDGVCYVLLPFAVISCTALFLIAPLAEFSHTQLYGPR